MEKGSSQYDKKVIEILKEHPNGLLRREIFNLLQKKMEKTTQGRLTESLKRLTERYVVRQAEREDLKKGKTFKDKYYLVALERHANPDKLHGIMELYKKVKKDNNKPLMVELQKEIEDIFLNYNVRDKTFINFIIEEAKQTNQDTHIIRMCLGHLATNLRKAIEAPISTMEYVFNYDEKHLLQIIVSTQDQLEKIIFDRKRSYIERLEIFDTIRQFSTFRIVDIAFKLLSKLDTREKKYDKAEFEKQRGIYSYSSVSFSNNEKEKMTEFQIFEKDVEEVILNYAIRDPDDCKIRLWDLLSTDTDKIIANKINNLLETIRAKSHNRQETYISERSPSFSFDVTRRASPLWTTSSLSSSEISEIREMLRERKTGRTFGTFSRFPLYKSPLTITETKKKREWGEK